MERRRPRILVVGSLVMDLIVSMDRFPERGETVSGHGFQTAPGGKGANQAVQAARLGAAVTLLGKTGADDFGARLRDSAAAAGVDITHIGIDADAPSAIGNIQLETALGRTQNRICVVPGANMRITPADVAFLREEIAGYDMVLLQLEIPMEINCLVAAYAKQKGVPVMLNSAPYQEMPAELLRNVTYLSPNEHEASDMSGVEITDVSTAGKAAERIHAMGVEKVLITLGHRGAALYDGGELLFSPAAKNVRAVDPTAAGDSFVAAFSTAVCWGMPAAEALTFANHTAALTVERMGAQPSLPSQAEVFALLERSGDPLPAKWKEEVLSCRI